MSCQAKVRVCRSSLTVSPAGEHHTPALTARNPTTTNRTAQSPPRIWRTPDSAIRAPAPPTPARSRYRPAAAHRIGLCTATVSGFMSRNYPPGLPGVAGDRAPKDESAPAVAEVACNAGRGCDRVPSRHGGPHTRCPSRHPWCDASDQDVGRIVPLEGPHPSQAFGFLSERQNPPRRTPVGPGGREKPDQRGTPGGHGRPLERVNPVAESMDTRQEIDASGTGHLRVSSTTEPPTSQPRSGVPATVRTARGWC